MVQNNPEKRAARNKMQLDPTQELKFLNIQDNELNTNRCDLVNE